MKKKEFLRDGLPVELAAKEFAVLRHFIVNPNKRLSRQVLLEQRWEYTGALNTRTIDVHIAQLRQKLEGNPKQSRHILTVFRSATSSSHPPRFFSAVASYM